MTFDTLGRVALRVAAKLKRARLAQERSSRENDDIPALAAGNDNTIGSGKPVMQTRPQFADGTWRGAPRRE